MINTQEAIKILEHNLENSDDSIFEDALEAIKTQYLALQLTIAAALKLLESEPEPTEFTERMLNNLRCSKPDMRQACGIIDRLTAELRSANDGVAHGNEVFEDLQAENARLKIEKYMLIVPSYMRGMLERGEISQKDLDKWYKQALERKP